MIHKERWMYKQALKHGKNSRQSTTFKEYRMLVWSKIHSSYHKYLNKLLDPEEGKTLKPFGNSSKPGNRILWGKRTITIHSNEKYQHLGLGCKKEHPTPKQEESKWTRYDAHHILKTNSQHHNTSNIFIFQQSLDRGEIPTDWKNANIAIL